MAREMIGDDRRGESHIEARVRDDVGVRESARFSQPYYYIFTSTSALRLVA